MYNKNVYMLVYIGTYIVLVYMYEYTYICEYVGIYDFANKILPVWNKLAAEGVEA